MQWHYGVADEIERPTALQMQMKSWRAADTEPTPTMIGVGLLQGVFVVRRCIAAHLRS